MEMGIDIIHADIFRLLLNEFGDVKAGNNRTLQPVTMPAFLKPGFHLKFLHPIFIVLAGEEQLYSIRPI